MRGLETAPGRGRTTQPRRRTARRPSALVRVFGDQEQMMDVLRRIVARVTRDEALRDDLLQEGLLHLWEITRQRPGQTRSWYLQHCRFHLQRRLRIGRSLDSYKRRGGRISLSDHDLDVLKPRLDGDGLASARDILRLLWQRLSERERDILVGLVEGHAVRELARRLQVSHPTILKHRRAIAELALRLGIEPLPGPNKHSATVRPADDPHGVADTASPLRADPVPVPARGAAGEPVGRASLPGACPLTGKRSCLLPRSIFLAEFIRTDDPKPRASSRRPPPVLATAS